jgi:hypothetical protein
MTRKPETVLNSDHCCMFDEETAVNICKKLNVNNDIV